MAEPIGFGCKPAVLKAGLHLGDGIIEGGVHHGDSAGVNQADPSDIIRKPIEILPVRILEKQAGRPIPLGALAVGSIVKTMKNKEADSHGCQRIDPALKSLKAGAPPAAAHGFRHAALFAVHPRDGDGPFRFLQCNCPRITVPVAVAVRTRDMQVAHRFEIISLTERMISNPFLRMAR